MLTASCHCGAVRVTVARRPQSITNCNCSICRRHGALWAYYRQDSVRIDAAPDATQAYVWGRKALKFVRCRTCGCVTHWQRVAPVPGGRMGVNARNFEPDALGAARIRRLDGASSWTYLD